MYYITWDYSHNRHYESPVEIPSYYFSLDLIDNMPSPRDYPSKCAVVVFHDLAPARYKGKPALKARFMITDFNLKRRERL